MNSSFRLALIAVFALLLAGCLPSSRPFVKFQAVTASDHYPDYWIADTLHYSSNDEGDIAYLNALMKDGDYDQALYFCNNMLLTGSDTALRKYLLFKRTKMEFLSHFISHYGIDSVAGYTTARPRTHLVHSSIAKSLNRFLASENIDTCSFRDDTSFSSIGYPTEKDVRYSLSLISATRNRVKSVEIADSPAIYQAEKANFIRFLEEFELEIVTLGVWKYVQEGSWDSAVAYCEYMAGRYPVLKDNLLSAKSSIASRPRLKEKSPALAGVLSAIVPGTGQIYAGEASDGLLFFLGEGVQAGCAVYLLNGVDVRRDRSEMVFGATFSLTSILTHIANIKSAVEKTKDYNTELEKKEIKLFADSLKNSPPGYVR